MADYYCDHGAYPTYAATPTWNTAEEGDGKFGSGAVLTATVNAGAVTGITVTNGGSGYGSGTLVVFTGGGGAGATATAVVNSTGVIQSFTINAGGTGYTTAPTVTLCPGKSKPAIASVVLVGQPAATETLVVMGVTFTARTSGATGNEFNIGGTLAITCDNIATAINASTTNLSSTISTTTPQLRNLTFARGPGTGAASNTVEIMTRAGSFDLNHAVTSAVAITKTGAWTPTITNFAGGESGVWGYLTNNLATVWKSAVGINLYGACYSGANVGPLMVKTAAAVTDVVNMRARGQTHTISRILSANMPLWSVNTTYLWDNGTVWVGDSGQYNIVLLSNSASAATFGCLSGAINLRIVSRSKYNLKVTHNQSGSADGNFCNPQAASCRILIQNVEFEDLSSGGAGFLRIAVSAATGSVIVRNCKLTYYKTTFTSPFITGGNFNDQSLTVDGCEFNWPNFAGTPGNLVSWTGISGTGNRIEIVDCKATTINPGLEPITVTASMFSQLGNTVIARNLDGFRIPSAAFGVLGVSSSAPLAERGLLFMQNIGSDRATRLETPSVYVEWIPGQGFPVADSYLPNGTAWSYRMVYPSSSRNAIRLEQPVEIISLTKTNILAAGILNVDLELKLDDAYDHLITYSHLGIQVTYVANSDSKTRIENTDMWSKAVIPSSSKTWTDSAGSYNGTHVARKLGLTTSVAVKQNTEIEVRLIAFQEPANTQSLFINPELTITAA